MPWHPGPSFGGRSEGLGIPSTPESAISERGPDTETFPSAPRDVDRESNGGTPGPGTKTFGMPSAPGQLSSVR